MLIPFVNRIAKYYDCSPEDALAVSFRCKKSESPFVCQKKNCFDFCCSISSNGFVYFAFRNGNRFEYYKTFNPKDL